MPQVLSGGEVPRRSSRRTRILNQISIWFSHEPCFGVYTNRMRWVGSLRKAARVGIDRRMPALSFTPRSPGYASWAATRRTRVADGCVFNWSARKTHVASGSVASVRPMCAAKSASVRVGPTVGATTRPVTTSKLAISVCVPCRI